MAHREPPRKGVARHPPPERQHCVGQRLLGCEPEAFPGRSIAQRCPATQGAAGVALGGAVVEWRVHLPVTQRRCLLIRT